MKRSFLTLILSFIVTFFILNNVSNADEECQKIWNKSYCPPRGGDVVIQWDKAYCGLGECIVIWDKIICSSKKGGRVVQNFSEYKCSGSCVPGDPELCEVFEF